MPRRHYGEPGCRAQKLIDVRSPNTAASGIFPDSGINGINHAATRAKDILEIGLYNPAGTDLGLIGNFESELIGADRQRFASRKKPRLDQANKNDRLKQRVGALRNAPRLRSWTPGAALLVAAGRHD
jgi:hypothetical protein